MPTNPAPDESWEAMIGWLDDDPVDDIDDLSDGPMPWRLLMAIHAAQLRWPCHTCYHTFVHKTTVYLPDSLKRRLAEAARRRGQPEAELIRAAIERFLASEAPRPTLPLFRSGDPTLAEHVDEALAGFGE